MGNIVTSDQIFEISLDRLGDIRKDVNTILDTFITGLCDGNKPIDEYTKRVMTSYFAQFLVEVIMVGLLGMFAPKNLILVGGVFFNVKLNKILCDIVPGKTCVMPLAGDQGAGLGVYQQYLHGLKWPGHLFWGKRDPFTDPNIPGIEIYNDPKISYDSVAYELDKKGKVNLVRGAMEFGPRTLCNTSTLAIPTAANAAAINAMNQRTNEMPFALVMTQAQAEDLFVDLDRVHRSLEYMIITREFKWNKGDSSLIGGAHYYPIQDVYTCRPQITSEPEMVKLLEHFGPLINTSFNFHGQPIVYDLNQIIYNHTKQRETADIITVLINE
jgi:predicted NodU family carbamoyl transferase